jgi:hypothetical protein
MKQTTKIFTFFLLTVTFAAAFRLRYNVEQTCGKYR